MQVLAEKGIPDTAARMGRPPLGKTAQDTKPTPIRFEAGMRARIDQARGDQKFAEFIREAVERELKRRGQ
jgi:hypothetical protein